jgi:hypothetical protein
VGGNKQKATRVSEALKKVFVVVVFLNSSLPLQLKKKKEAGRCFKNMAPKFHFPVVFSFSPCRPSAFIPAIFCFSRPVRELHSPFARRCALCCTLCVVLQQAELLLLLLEASSS